MPPKKAPATETATSKSDYKPEEIQFVFQCLKAFDDDGVMNFSVLSRAAGHTNLASTRNAFNRYKKRYGFGNVPTKTGDGQVIAARGENDEEGESEHVVPSIEKDTLKPKTAANNKVTKKRGRPSAASKKAAAAAAAAVAAAAAEENDDNSEDNEDNEIPASSIKIKTEQESDDTD